MSLSACSNVDNFNGPDSGLPLGNDDAGNGMPGACHAGIHTCADVYAAFANNTMDAVVNCDEHTGIFTIKSTGVPSYMSNQKTPNDIEDQMWFVVLPLNPVCGQTPADVINSRGPIGFAVNGIPFYGPQDQNGNDAVINEGPSFDDCDGHADQSCSYHYHEEPVCVFGKGDTAANHALPDGHPPVIGFAMDGFSVYASQPGAVLDKCNGHVDAKRGYHYHATKSIPYLLGCYMGKPTGTMMRVPACMNGKPVDGGMMNQMPDMAMPQMPDGGMMTPCQNGMCPQNQVCCPQGLGCAGNCVPDCRLLGMCPMPLHCNGQNGVCTP